MDYQLRICEAIKRPTNSIVVPTPAVVIASVSTKPRLTKLTLPKFRGELTAWKTFWDSLKSTIHENADMSKIELLKSLLEGPASSRIQGLTLSEANYGATITMLQERFSRPQQIITAHLEELLTVQGSIGNCVSFSW